MPIFFLERALKTCKVISRFGISQLALYRMYMRHYFIWRNRHIRRGHALENPCLAKKSLDKHKKIKK